MKGLQEKAKRYLSEGYNCAEAIFLTFLQAYGEDPKNVRLATPFGAGIGVRRDLCGILTGGVMVIGLREGRTEEDEIEKKKRSYQLAANFYCWFENSFGVHCSDIIKGKFRGHTAKCVRIIGQATDYLAARLACPAGK